VAAAAVFALMSTWRQGRQALFRRLYQGAQPLNAFLSTCMQRMPPRIAGTAVFLTGNSDTVPRSLLHNLKHNKVLHERIVILKVETAEAPRVPSDERLTVEHLADNFYRIIVRYGFMEQPDIPLALRQCQLHGLAFNLMDTSFFLSRETIIPSIRPDLTPWREQIFIALSHLALSATEFFRLPPDRVVELGSQVEM
jgi:KUP system potassium uptake protein